jgi:transcriptional antiterminator
MIKMIEKIIIIVFLLFFPTPIFALQIQNQSSECQQNATEICSQINDKFGGLENSIKNLYQLDNRAYYVIIFTIIK